MKTELDIITIDGPAGVGKSTVSKIVAHKSGFTYLDTGAMYRAVGLYLERRKLDLNDEAVVHAALESIELELLPPKQGADDITVLLNGEDVSELIRSPEMAMVASKVSALPQVRACLTEMQRELGERGKVVVEGRDTGTVVFPAARFKFYLDALPEQRARRRYNQLVDKGGQPDYELLLSQTKQRDKDDSERAIAPLKKADDAVCIDTTILSIEDVVAQILQTVQDRRRSGEGAQL